MRAREEQTTDARRQAIRRLILGQKVATQEDLRELLASQGFDVFVAVGLTPGTPELELEEQDLRSQWFGRAEVEAMIREGGITDDCTLAAYTLFLLAGNTAG